jgi:hypothetical protein
MQECALTWQVLLCGEFLREEFSLELAIVLALGQPAAAREVPLGAQLGAVNLHTVQEPVPAHTSIVMEYPANTRLRAAGRDGMLRVREWRR